MSNNANRDHRNQRNNPYALDDLFVRFHRTAAGVLPWPRRRFWCVLTRHRIQRLCWEARLHTRSGRLPLILWTRPTKVGIRLHLLCRAGICAEDFDAHRGELRAACYAREARVTRNRKWSQLVTIDIIRHDTLAAGNTIISPP